MSVAVSIINYNSKELLRSLLKSLLSQKTKGLEIWVVDNDSPDDGKDMIKKEFKQVRLIESEENGGYATGHNLSIKRIIGNREIDYILILNPDTKVPDGTIENMTKFMDDYPICGIASCKIIGFDKSLHSNGGDLPLGTALFSWIFNLEMIPGAEKILGNFHRTDPQYYQQVKKVGWVGGTFMMIRREVFEKVGYLPEDYFMYFEDADFCYYVQQAGFDVMINPEVFIEHKSGASSDHPHLAQFKGEWRGLEIFYRKEFGEISAWAIKLLIYIGILLRMVAFTLVGKPKIAKIYGKVITAI